MKKNNKYIIRRTHRILGVLIGIQFLFWTISGLYFSWTDIDEIHGDHFLKAEEPAKSANLIGISEFMKDTAISDLAIRHIDKEPYYWINNEHLYHARTGKKKNGITEQEAIAIVRDKVRDEYKILDASLINSVGPHDEYRGRPLPAWVVRFEEPEHLVAYVSANDGSFQRVRHREWRWFDFLWMFHTMDYEGRDDFNNFLLRAFSLFGLLTVISGFTLYFATSKRVSRIFKTK
jgi:hypothetical protein